MSPAPSQPPRVGERLMQVEGEAERRVPPAYPSHCCGQNPGEPLCFFVLCLHFFFREKDIMMKPIPSQLGGPHFAKSLGQSWSLELACDGAPWTPGERKGDTSLSHCISPARSATGGSGCHPRPSLEPASSSVGLSYMQAGLAHGYRVAGQRNPCPHQEVTTPHFPLECLIPRGATAFHPISLPLRIRAARPPSPWGVFSSFSI